MHDKSGPLALSKREHFAALILAGISSNPSIDTCTSFEDLAKVAIDQADALLEMLAYSPEVIADPGSEGETDESQYSQGFCSPEEYYRPMGASRFVPIPESIELDALRNELYKDEILLGGGCEE